MKIVHTLLIILLFSFNSFAKNNKGSEDMFYISFGEKEISCQFAESKAAEELKEILAKGAITINMENYGGFEKVGMAIMYGNNSWSYTRLGKITGLSSSEIYNILSKAGNSAKVYMKP